MSDSSNEGSSRSGKSSDRSSKDYSTTAATTVDSQETEDDAHTVHRFAAKSFQIHAETSR